MLLALPSNKFFIKITVTVLHKKLIATGTTKNDKRNFISSDLSEIEPSWLTTPAIKIPLNKDKSTIIKNIVKYPLFVKLKKKPEGTPHNTAGRIAIKKANLNLSPSGNGPIHPPLEFFSPEKNKSNKRKSV
jgi:hypothetical protein